MSSPSETPTCGRGWGDRCARAKSPRCTCRCGGHNHGNPAARRGEEQMSLKLTNAKVFEPTWDEAKGDYVPTRYFLPLADAVADVHCARSPVGGMRNADGSHLGDALVDIPQRFVYHSPTGFEWGYGGSGPADLALNVLGLFVPPPEAWRLHQDFKRDVVASLPREGGTIESAVVRDWIQNHWADDFRRENSQSGR